MAFITHDGARPMGLAARAKRILGAMIHSVARTEELERLQAKSDVELARMGLTRADIARHVFRNRVSL